MKGMKIENPAENIGILIENEDTLKNDFTAFTIMYKFVKESKFYIKGETDENKRWNT